ncbi:MAG: flagellar protein FlaG [Treponemataceae bacterium]
MGMAITGFGTLYQPPEHIVDQVSARNGNAYHAPVAERVPASVTHQELDTATKDLERLSLAFNKKLRFSIDQATDEVIVKVIDAESDKVIKELPPKELQRLHQKLKEMIGLLIDEIV